MQIKLFKKNKGILRKICATYRVVNFLTKEDYKNLSVAISKAKDHNEITKNIKSNRLYYVLKGKLIVKNRNKKFIAEKGDILFISKNTKYQFQGTFEAIIINSPAFDSKYEKILEKGIKKAKISNREKIKAQKRLYKQDFSKKEAKI